MATSYSTEAIWAICEMAVKLPSTFLPTATLTQAAHVGDSVLNVSDVRPFLGSLDGDGVVLSFWDREVDQTAEPPIAVRTTDPDTHTGSSPIPGTVTLDFSGQSYIGLQATHAQGIIVATNINDDFGSEIESSLQNGWPVLSVFALQRVDDWWTNLGTRTWQAHPTISCVYQLPYVRTLGQTPQGVILHPQLWSRSLTQKAEADMNALTLAVKQNPLLKLASGVPHAFKPVTFTRNRLPNIDRDPSPTWDEYLEIVIDSGADGTVQTV